jgi:hypothetical protein
MQVTLKDTNEFKPFIVEILFEHPTELQCFRDDYHESIELDSTTIGMYIYEAVDDIYPHLLDVIDEGEGN